MPLNMAHKEINSKDLNEKNIEVAIPAEDENMFVDGGYGWVIVLVCFITCMIANGLAFSSGIFYIEIVKAFKGGSVEVAWVLSLLRFFYMLIGPVVSIMLTKLGGRITIIVGSLLITAGFLISAFAPTIGVLNFSIGFLAGSGLGMNYQAAVVIINYYFLKRRGIANGLVGAGGGVGLLVFPLVINAFLDSFGFNGAFLLLAGIALQGVVCGALVLPPQLTLRMKKGTPKKKASITNLVSQSDININVIHKNKKGKQFHEDHKFLRSHDSTISYVSSVQHQKQFSGSNGHPATLADHIKIALKLTFDINEFKCPFFLIIALSQLFFNYAFPTIFVFIPDRARGLGLNMEQSSFLLSMSGISGIVAKFTCGLVADTAFMRQKRLNLYAVGFLIGGFGTVINYGPSFGQQITMSALLGCCGGIVYTLLCIVLADIVGVERLTRTYGMINFLSAFAALAGPALSGWLFDRTRSYNLVFASLGISLFLGGLITLIIPCIGLYNGTVAIRCLMVERDNASRAIHPDQAEHTDINVRTLALRPQ